jgi:hypothetical protein
MNGWTKIIGYRKKPTQQTPLFGCQARKPQECVRQCFGSETLANIINRVVTCKESEFEVRSLRLNRD